MGNIAVRIEGVGKKYVVGGRRENYRTLRDTLADFGTRSRKALRAALGSGDGYIYGNEVFWALKDVSFEVKHGEVVGIIGRNGAGKSTLLKIVSQITEPTEGSIDLYGRTAALLEVGTGFHPELTGRENVYLNGAILGMTRAEINRKFDEIVAFSEIEKFIDTPVKHYSSGMGLRLGFAVAAFLEPEILIVDEVLAVGDAAFQKKCIGKMEEVASTGRTVLFVSHNMTAVLNLCTRGVLLESGVVTLIDDPETVVTHYMNSSLGGTVGELAQRTDRSGSGRLKFERIWLEDVDGRTVNYIPSGEGGNIMLKYCVQSGTVLDNVHVALTFLDLYGQKLFSLETRFVGQAFNYVTNEGIFCCYVPALPLIPDTYIVNLWSSVNGIACDIIEDAFRVAITESNFLGGGVRPEKRKHGVFIIPHSWKRMDS